MASREGLEQEELTRAQSKASSTLVLASERPGNRLFDVGGRWLREQPYRTVREEVDAYQGVGVDDLGKLLVEYPLEGGMLVSVGPVDLVPPRLQ